MRTLVIGLPPGAGYNPNNYMVTGTISRLAQGRAYRVACVADDGVSPAVYGYFTHTVGSDVAPRIQAVTRAPRVLNPGDKRYIQGEIGDPFRIENKDPDGDPTITSLSANAAALGLRYDKDSDMVIPNIPVDAVVGRHTVMATVSDGALSDVVAFNVYIEPNERSLTRLPQRVYSVTGVSGHGEVQLPGFPVTAESVASSSDEAIIGGVTVKRNSDGDYAVFVLPKRTGVASISAVVEGVTYRMPVRIAPGNSLVDLAVAVGATTPLPQAAETGAALRRYLDTQIATVDNDMVTGVSAGQAFVLFDSPIRTGNIVAYGARITVS